MMGLSDKGWLVEMIHEHLAADEKRENLGPDVGDEYGVYFGLGRTLRLLHRPKVFKVSAAGVALGAYVSGRMSGRRWLDQPMLDLGTGSGVLSLMLRELGAADVLATDVCPEALDVAKANELLNFDNSCIRYALGDLFDAVGAAERFQTVFFNPPGWRSPSARLQRELARVSREQHLPLSAMFGGDSVLLRFLDALPRRLLHRGRAIVGLNSLVGIRDVLARYRACHHGRPPLSFRLLERHTLPLLFYTDGWRSLEPSLRLEFEDWRRAGLAAFTSDSRGRLYWSYEIVECRSNAKDACNEGY